MSAESTIILAGFFITITPFLGLPSSWYAYIFAVLGLIVFGTGILLRARHMPITRQPTQPESERPVDNHDTEPPHEPSPIA